MPQPSIKIVLTEDQKREIEDAAARAAVKPATFVRLEILRLVRGMAQ